jgi:hypothetical protein
MGMTERPLEGYARLLRTRKRWAMIGSVVLGICALVLLIAAFGLLWMKRLQPVTGTDVLVVLATCVYPLLAVVSQLVAYRQACGLLELLDVLEREIRVQEREGQQTET